MSAKVASFDEFQIAFGRLAEIFAVQGRPFDTLSERQQRKLSTVTAAMLAGHLVIARRMKKTVKFTIKTRTR